MVDGGGESPGRDAIDEDLKERAMDEAPVGITLADPSRPDNPLVYVNDSFVAMTGYDRGAVLGRNCRFLQGPDSEPEPVAAMREAIDDERPVSVELRNYRADGSMFWNQVKIAPLRDADGTVTHFVGFQMDVTARKEAELAVERERADLDRLVDRINGILGDVTADLVAADSRAAVETALVERLAGADPYDGAWLGRLDIGGDRVRPTAAAGSAADRDVDPSGDGPVARAVRTDAVATGPAADGSGDTVAAVPVTARGTTYGVLVVRSADPAAIDDRETVVLAALARSAATAINAIESRRLLTADQVVELELVLTDADLFLVGLSTGRSLALDGTVAREDGDVLAFVTVPGDDDVAGLLETARERPDVRAADVLVEHEDGTLVELLVDSPLLALLGDRGARLADARAEDGRAHVRVELPAGGDARGLVAALEDRFEGTDLLALREADRPMGTRQRFVDTVEARLTDRQLTAVRKAYHAGYFDPERGVGGDELAASMDISRSTFHQHLRAAERKLLAGFFGDD